MNRELAISALDEFIEINNDEMLDFVRRLIAIPSMTPPGDEREIVNVIDTEMKRLYLEPSIIVGRSDTRPNLIYRLEGNHDGPTLMLNGHTDTKPIGDIDAWKTDPFEATFAEDRLYGLGSSDMKSGCAALIYATAALLPYMDQLRGDILLVLSADEEGGGTFGADWLINQYGLRADVALIAEPAGIFEPWEVLPVLCRGTCAFTIRVHGTQMHSSIMDQQPSINASTKMASVLSRIEDELIVRYPAHPLCPQGITINAGAMVQGGVYYGITSGFAEFSSDIRVLPGMTLEEMKEDIEIFLQRLKNEDPDLDVELVFERENHWLPAAEISSDHPFVTRLSMSADRVLQKHIPLGSVPYATDARTFWIDGGIPTVPGFGPGIISQCHVPNEFVHWKEIISAAKIYASAAYDYLSASSVERIS